MKNTSGRLYRIMSFHHVVQLFENNEMFFARPSKWADPYETRLVHSAADQVFAQCWCSNGVSDAMWRIYSPDHLGVRISTSTRKLRQALLKAAEIRNMTVRLGDVRYVSQQNIQLEARKIHRDLQVNYSVERASDLLFLKRSAFNHEDEYRALLTVDTPNVAAEATGLKVPVNPHKLIDNILVDPRAPKELADALIYYFKNHIGYKRRVSPSVLYKMPTPLVVP